MRGIASIVTAGLPTIGLRVPAHPAMQALLRAVGRPLAAPSANASGSISPTRAEHVAEEPRRTNPADHRRRRRPSAVWNRPSSPRPAARCGCFGPGPIAGRCRTRVRASRSRRRASSRAIMRRRSRCGSTRRAAGRRISDRLRRRLAGDASLSPSGDLVEAAARLFDLLHQADASAKPRIAVAPVPDEGLGAARSTTASRRAASLSRSPLRALASAPGSSCAASAAWAGSRRGNRGSAGPRRPNNPGDSPRPDTIRPSARSW